MTTTYPKIQLIFLSALLLVFIASCKDSGLNSDSSDIINLQETKSKAHNSSGGVYNDFTPAAYSIDAAPDGSILVTQNNKIRQIRKGTVSDVIEIPTPGSPLNGVESIGRRSYFVTTGGLDLALGAGVWHVSEGDMKLIGDIESYEIENDPDANAGPKWKNILCEEDPTQGFSAGPQSNPYHMKAISGSEVLVADAAGNTLLEVNKNGTIELVAVFTPPVDNDGEYLFLKNALDDSSVDCYVQPVPTSVAVGPNGDYFVGELTGGVESGLPTGYSRIWQIESGAKNTVCPSEKCTLFKDDLTSVIDIEFGPDGYLYVVEYEGNSWLAAVVPSIPITGGTIKRCKTNTGECQVIAGDEEDLILPASITFDKRGNLWVLDNNLIAPSVRMIDIN